MTLFVRSAKRMNSTYVYPYDDCDCGSTTYGHRVRSWNFEKGIMQNGVRCGGCDKITFMEKSNQNG